VKVDRYISHVGVAVHANVHFVGITQHRFFPVLIDQIHQGQPVPVGSAQLRHVAAKRACRQRRGIDDGPRNALGSQLRPKHGDTSAHRHPRIQHALLHQFQHLLRLHKVGHMALRIDSARQKSLKRRHSFAAFKKKKIILSWCTSFPPGAESDAK
jgi:hypothetical protein